MLRILLSGQRPIPFGANLDSPQAEGLVAWWPMIPLNVAFDMGNTGRFPLANNGPSPTVDREMGRVFDFVAASSQFFNIESAVLTDYPFTFSCWFKVNDISNNYAFVFLADSSDTQFFNVLQVRGDEPGKKVSCFTATHGGAADGQADTTTSFVAGKWHLATGTFPGVSERNAFIDGGSKGSNTETTGSISGYDRTDVGRLGVPSPIAHLDGQIADARIYDRILSDAEVFDLWHLSTRWDLYKSLDSKAIRKSTVSVPVVLAAPKEKRPAYFEINRESSQAQGLVGWWPFAGNSQTLFDFSGHPNNGSLENGAVWGVNESLGGQAVDFDGADARVEINTNPTLDDLGPMSVSVWLKPRSAGEGNLGRIIGKEGTGSPDGRWWIEVENTAPEVLAVQFEKDLSGSTGAFRTTDDNTIVLNVWQNIVVTWDGSNQGTGVHIYKNGFEQTYQDVGNDGSGVSDAGMPLTIGNRTDNDRGFDGLIDDVRIYNRVLADAEVLALYDLSTRWDLYKSIDVRERKTISRQKPLVSFVTPPRTPQGKRPEYFEINRESPQANGLVAWWPFFGKSQTTLFDFSGRRKHGVVNNGVWVPNVSLGGNALNFNGTDDQVEYTPIEDLISLSISAWVLRRQVTVEVVVGNNHNSSILIFGPFGGGADLTLAYTGGETVTWDDLAPGVGAWHHVVITYDRPINEAIAYVDGLSLGPRTFTTPATWTGNGRPRYIGREFDNGFFDGLMDDIRIYNRALPPSEALSLYDGATRWDLYKSLVDDIRIANVAEIIEPLGDADSTPLVGAAVLAGIALHMDLGITVPAIRR